VNLRLCAACGEPFQSARSGHRFCSRDCQLRGRFLGDVALELPTHLVIPDTQARRGVASDHLRWIGQYVVDQFLGRPLTIIHLGDHWDMPSLSSYDRGKKAMEGRRYKVDIAAGNRAFEVLNTPLEAAADESGWTPRRVLLRGNHEDRITRAIDADAQLDGLLSLDDLASPGWEVHPFLKPVEIDGVVYAHYFYNPMTGRPYGGANIETRLKTIGHSFTMGHQQGLGIGMRYVNGQQQIGLVAGSCYQHDEDYKGWQGNAHWRGIIVCHQVHGGSYDPMFVSLDYLCRRYEGHRLSEHRGVEL
jgi:hypothetical protein